VGGPDDCTGVCVRAYVYFGCAARITDEGTLGILMNRHWQRRRSVDAEFQDLPVCRLNMTIHHLFGRRDDAFVRIHYGVTIYGYHWKTAMLGTIVGY
jgi:hypothetical protein